ncbi:MAG TPA: YciI family protein [Dermatophilaceae bacterium]|nr:YciI family protein [Dermatophilaceae bacterium]
MKYLVLLAHEPGMWTEADEATFAAYHQGHVDFARAVGAHQLAGEALAGTGTATTLRRNAGRDLLTDGPYAEGPEMIGGFYLLDAPDLDTVLGWCRLLPEPYAIEVRPCVPVSGLTD